MSSPEPRVVFFGSGEIAIPSFRRLLNDGPPPVALVTQPDKPAGRHRTLTPPPIKEVAVQAGVQVLQPESARDEVFLDELRHLAPDLIIVMAYGQILPKALIDIPKIACINLHGSLLPRHRGASCVQAAIDAGDAITGVTVMHVVPKLDAGDMIHAESTPISDSDTGTTVHDRLADLAASALFSSLSDLISGTARRTPQDPELVTYSGKLGREDGRLDWTRDAQAIERRIRAYHPWPGTWTTVDDGSGPKRLKVFPVGTGADSKGEPGTFRISEEGEAWVSCGSGHVVLGEVQADGSRRMAARDWLKGLRGNPVIR